MIRGFLSTTWLGEELKMATLMSEESGIIYKFRGGSFPKTELVH